MTSRTTARQAQDTYNSLDELRRLQSALLSAGATLPVPMGSITLQLPTAEVQASVAAQIASLEQWLADNGFEQAA